MRDLLRLDRVFMHNSLMDWLIALAVVIVVLLAVSLVKRFTVRRLSVLARHTQTRIDDALVKAVQATQLWLVLPIALYAAAAYLTLGKHTPALLQKLAVVAVFVQLGLWVTTLLQFWINYSRQRALEADASAATSLSAVGLIIKIALWVLILLLGLDNLGVNVSALVTSLGIGGVAIALAVQNILGDLLASISILADKPFVLGDFIIVDNFMGTVEHIGLKTTRLRSLDGEQIVVSNGDLLKSRLRNYKRMRERRVLFRFGVLYQTTVEQLERIPQQVQAAVEALPNTRFDRAHFKGFGDSSLDFEVVYWMLDPDYNHYMDAQQAINLTLMRAFAAEGVEFAYPTRTLIVDGTVRVEATPPSRQSVAVPGIAEA